MFKKREKQTSKQLIDICNNRNNLNKCGECAAEYPTWASWNLGILLCGRCASLHKKVLSVEGPSGRPISRVKSLTLESWSDDQIESLRRIGNRRARNRWNPKRVPFPHGDDTDDGPIEQFFKDKYIYGRFRDDNIDDDEYEDRGARYSDHSAPSTPIGRRSRSSTVNSRRNGTLPRLSHRKLTSYEQTLYPGGLRQLSNMGYSDRDLTLEALILANGDVDTALDILENDSRVNPSQAEIPPDLPRRPRPSTAPSANGSGQVPTATTGTASSSAPEWWNNQQQSQQALQAQQTMQMQQQQPQIYQYTDPTTGQISYIDQNGNQYLDPNNPQHQQMLMQQTNPQLVAQQTAKQNILSLYNQPTGAPQQQPQQPQQTSQFQQQATGYQVVPQQTQPLNQYATGVPSQQVSGMYGQPQAFAQPAYSYGQQQYYG